ncbi:MAG: outer membrane protein assembly factor BamB family protein [Gaiellaceae bacterium]
MRPTTRSSRARHAGEIRYYRTERRSYAPLFALAAAAAFALAAANVAVARGLFAGETAPTARALDRPRVTHAPPPRTRPAARPRPRATPRARAQPLVGAINPKVPGLTTFRGNLTRSYYGEGPVPRRSPRILWRYPQRGGMCSRSTDEAGTTTWCGVGWTGQPNVIPRPNGAVELRFGAYDRGYHFLDARTGTPVRRTLITGDLAKGSATSDPDGYPLYYAGSRDDRLRVVALDRRHPRVLWQLDANTSVPKVVWNNDWDGAPLIVGDYMLVGGENSWFYVVRLHRGYDRHGKVRVRPQVVLRVPSWDGRLLAATGARAFSIENSVAFHRGVAYFANSAGLVQGWDLRRVLKGGRTAKRVFRFWTGDDTDASVVVDAEGFLYVASELERFDGRSRQVGQLMKLDPRRPGTPLVWSVPLPAAGAGGKGGSWSTPALDRGTVYVATNAGGVVGVDRRTGKAQWRIPLPGPTWGSPVVVDGVLLEGDCRGVLHAFDVAREGRRPRELWSIRLGGCIESTPAVWKGRVYVGTRGGAMYALG